MEDARCGSCTDHGGSGERLVKRRDHAYSIAAQNLIARMNKTTGKCLSVYGYVEAWEP